MNEGQICGFAQNVAEMLPIYNPEYVNIRIIWFSDKLRLHFEAHPPKTTQFCPMQPEKDVCHTPQNVFFFFYCAVSKCMGCLNQF